MPSSCRNSTVRSWSRMPLIGLVGIWSPPQACDAHLLPIQCPQNCQLHAFFSRCWQIFWGKQLATIRGEQNTTTEPVISPGRWMTPVAMVVHVTKVVNGACHADCAFEKPLAGGMLEALL